MPRNAAVFTCVLKCLGFFALVLVPLASSAGPQATPGVMNQILPPPERVSEHVYAWIGPHGGPSKDNQGYRMNMAFVVGSKAVVVLETGYTAEMAKEMLGHISRITKAPVKYAINSNSQPDRFMGNQVFHDIGATIIANESEVRRMDRLAAQYARSIEQSLQLSAGSVKVPSAPNKVIQADMELDLGGVTIQIKSLGAAHTPSPLVVLIPKDKVIYAGDILYSGRVVALLPDGNVKSWIEVFDKLRGYGDVTFVPGHGRPGKLATFEFSTYQYLTHLNNHMAKMIDTGVPLQDAIDSADQSKFSKLENFEDLAGINASITYLEREAEYFGK